MNQYDLYIYLTKTQTHKLFFIIGRQIYLLSPFRSSKQLTFITTDNNCMVLRESWYVHKYIWHLFDRRYNLLLTQQTVKLHHIYRMTIRYSIVLGTYSLWIPAFLTADDTAFTAVCKALMRAVKSPVAWGNFLCSSSRNLVSVIGQVSIGDPWSVILTPLR